ncbi:MAG: hypothetical protein QM731_00980 [Chitinophagaceae bacterium]
MTKWILLLLLIRCMPVTGYSQDTLPNFSVVDRGNNKIIISWTNTNQSINQISIQRSLDSTRNFKTIMTVPDPRVPQNGFADAKVPNAVMFYRLFIVLDSSGKYTFTPSKKAYLDTTTKEEPRPSPAAENIVKSGGKKETFAAGLLIIKRRDTIVQLIPEKDFKKFRDSLMFKTKDTLSSRHGDTFLIKPFVPKAPKEVIVVSKYVHPDKEGNILIQIPVSDHHYSVKFFEENNSFLFEIKQVKGPLLIVDKVNFVHAGTFLFELYEDGKLKEKNKIVIPKDF